MSLHHAQLEDILDFSHFQLSDIKPSEWAEASRTLSPDETPFPGPFRFRHAPYTVEILNRLSPDDPARIVAVMKGAQIMFSTSVIENSIGYIISEQPGPTLFLSGHVELSEEAMTTKIDKMIDSCGLRKLIRPAIVKKRNARTGDTSKMKEFPGGILIAGGASNDKLLKQRSMRYGFIDDFDGAKKATKQSGSTRRTIEQRFAAYYDKMKLFYISTPELKQTSNIEPAFLLGDQRRYFVPCPLCGDYVWLQWEIELESGEKAGITWKVDERGRLIADSVGYVCQSCSGFFTDSLKPEMNRAGEWRATAEPSEVGYYSYHISSLYAAPGMYDWEHYVRQYLEACPPGAAVKEKEYQTFVNLALGEPYEQKGKAVQSNNVQKKIRSYPINVIPEKMSIEDGNGKIVMLTCACDLNGVEEDARLDYEIVAWSETGSSYSIRHGSIGTFIYKENTLKVKKDREKWTYQAGRQRSVWPELDRILAEGFQTDTGRKMRILLCGVDCGHYTNHAYAYIDRIPSPINCTVIGLKGDKEGKYRKFGIDMPIFKYAKERTKLFLLDVNEIKDITSANLDLEWLPGMGESQPPDFMNFPQPSEGLYLYHNFFSHFEAEHRVIDSKDGEAIAARWIKKKSSMQNHFWDTKIYNYGLREIWADMCLKAFKPPQKGNWHDFVNYLRRNKMI